MIVIDPVALRALVALAEEGSVHGAAGVLGYTPSAVSQQIKRLSDATGTALVEKVGRSLVLTAAGAQLVDEAGELLRHMEAVEARVLQSSGRAVGTIRLAAFATALRGLVPGALGALRDAAPDVAVTMSEIDPWQAVDAVAAASVDCAIVHNWDPMPLSVPPHVAVTSLGRDEADVVMPRGHRLAGAADVGPADLRGENWVSVGAGSICHQWLSWLFHEIGERPAVIHEALEYETHLALVRPAGVLALIPRLGRGELPAGLVARPLRQPARRHVMFVHRASMTSHPALEAVRASVLLAAREVISGPVGP